MVVHDKIEEMGLKSKLTLRAGGGGGKNLSVNLTLSVQWVGMDGFPYTCQDIGLKPPSNLFFTSICSPVIVLFLLVSPFYTFLCKKVVSGHHLEMIQAQFLTD